MVQPFPGLGLAAPAEPVDNDMGVAARLGQMACGIGGELQDSRAAHPLMGDEERAFGLVFRTGQGDDGRLYHRTGQLPERLVAQAEAEERRYGQGDDEAEGPKLVEARQARNAARGDDDAVRLDAMSFRVGEGQDIAGLSAVGLSPVTQVGDAMSRPEDDTVAAHGGEEGRDDFFGALRAWKYAFVLLRDQSDTLAFEPRHRVAVAELAQQALHQPCAAWINGFDASHAGEGVGQVAAPAARDGDLGERAAGALVDGDFGLGPDLLDADGGETARRAGTDNSNLHVSRFGAGMNRWDKDTPKARYVRTSGVGNVRGRYAYCCLP